MPLDRHRDLLRRVGGSVALLVAATGLSYLLPHRFPGVPATLYFLATLGVTRLLGGWAGFGAALFSVALLFYLFVPPIHTLRLDTQSATLLFVYVASVAIGTVLLNQPRRGEQRSRLEVDRMTILQSLTSDLAQVTTRAEVGTAAVDALSRMYDVRSAFLAVLVPGSDELEIVAERGLPEVVTARWRRIPLNSETAVADAIRDRQPVLLRSLDERRRRYPSSEAER